MDIVTQLAVFLANQPGTLADVCDELARANINIYALTISDTVDHAVVRMVVSDTRKALHIFGERGVLVVENDVLMVNNTNKPGGLSRLAKKLSEHKINIEYAYLATNPDSKKGLLILRVSNSKKALQVLTATENGQA
ncbi:MAG: ACT domain-containing protein [Verrucomicrobiota bacterium]